jgi:hypothetical protein
MGRYTANIVSEKPATSTQLAVVLSSKTTFTIHQTTFHNILGQKRLVRRRADQQTDSLKLMVKITARLSRGE